MKVSGTVRVPGDKSISHRALIFAAIAEGKSNIRGILESADVQSTAAVLRALHGKIPALSPEFAVKGQGFRGFVSPDADLYCGNSGTTARLICGAIAGSDARARLTGDASLTKRPMGRVAEPLMKMGARIEFESGQTLPMTVEGHPLKPIDWSSQVASGQVKSAILLASLMSGAHVSFREPVLSRDHTERLLHFLGADVKSSGSSLTFSPPAAIPGFELDVPGDPSSAAYFAALAALSSAGEIRITDVCINPTRLGFFRVLQRFGAQIEFSNSRNCGGEDVADMVCRPGEMRDILINARETVSMIDELPLLACVAAGANVTVTVRGAEELRVKESDRIKATVDNLKAIGVEAEELPDGFIVGKRKGALRGKISTFDDHRIAMSFGILSAMPENEIEISEKDSVAISYPAFWTDLKMVVQ